MTIKSYLKKLKHKLYLPDSLRQEELNHLLETIDRQIMAHRSWEDISESLGTPEAAARRIQSKYPQYSKNPWRFLFLFQGCFGLLGLVVLLISRFLPHCVLLHGAALFVSSAVEAASVGIIGGADGPTAVYITQQSPSFWMLKLLFLVLITGLGFYLSKRCRVTCRK